MVHLHRSAGGGSAACFLGDPGDVFSYDCKAVRERYSSGIEEFDVIMSVKTIDAVHTKWSTAEQYSSSCSSIK